LINVDKLSLQANFWADLLAARASEIKTGSLAAKQLKHQPKSVINDESAINRVKKHTIIRPTTE
jgi:hypothetical protein